MKIISLAPEVLDMAAKIKRNDEVIVLAGKDKGKRGKVLVVRPDGRLSSAASTLWKHWKSNR